MTLSSATQHKPNVWRQSMRRMLLATAPRAGLIASGPPTRGEVCLTFDDGPDQVATPHVLDALAVAGARATFFLQGSNANAQRALVKRIHDEGHDIGHHSWSHSPPSETAAATLAEESVRTRELLRTVAGVETNLFRPPHGKLTVAKLIRLWAQRQTIVLWSADPGDVFQHSAESFVQWFEFNPPRPGDVILLHDRAPVLREGLPHLLTLVKSSGLRFATLGEWIERRPLAAQDARAA
jgi:peptidoglycan/xylan/chitin deacetylase (PgdA/CDA1 family)